jgi:hypothetical protein
MKPFEAPANANATTPDLAGLYAVPFALWTVGLEMAAQNWRLLEVMQRAALASFGAVDASPVAGCAAADVRETGEAVVRAQLDAINSIRRAV